MVDRNDIEGNVLGAIDAAFNGEWWDHLCDETQEDIRDKLCAVWNKFFPVQQNSATSEPAPQHLTGDKSEPADITPVDSPMVWSDTDVRNANMNEGY